MSQQIYHLKKILIPPKDDEETIKRLSTKEAQAELDDGKSVNRIQVTREFKKQTKCYPEEAQFYLEEANYDLKVALEQWESDNNAAATANK